MRFAEAEASSKGARLIEWLASIRLFVSPVCVRRRDAPHTRIFKGFFMPLCGATFDEILPLKGDSGRRQ
jgi:hypothetical protein